MIQLMLETLNQPLFWLVLSVLYFRVGQLLSERFHTPILNPLLVAVLLMAPTMGLLGADLTDYNAGGQFLTLFLTPVTVALAVPIYRKLEVLKRNLLPILCGALAGSLTSIASVLLLSRLFGLSREITMSLVPKSVTTPIGIRISQQIGGLPSLTAVVIVLTGILGAIVLPSVMKLLRLEEPVAQGVAMGTASHAFGTVQALQMGETQGAMSGLALGVAGVVTALAVAVFSMFL